MDPAASAASHCLFRSAPLLHISMEQCLTLKYFLQLKISHFFQGLWGVLLLPKTNMVSFTWQSITLIWRLISFETDWLGIQYIVLSLGKSTRYSCGTFLDGVYGVAMILNLPCWDWIWVTRDIYAKYAAYSKHCMWCHLHAWYDWNLLVVLHLCVASDILQKYGRLGRSYLLFL